MKYLDYEITGVAPDNKMGIRITCQKYITWEFGIRGQFKSQDKKLYLCSAEFPACQQDYCYVRGSCGERDRQTFFIDKTLLVAFRKLVTEYNIWQHVREPK